MTHFVLRGLPSQTPAWDFTNVLDLKRPMEVSGPEPTVIPGAHSGIPHRLWRRPTERIIEGKVFGRADRYGNRALNDPAMLAQLEANLDVLAAWAEPTEDDGTETVTAYTTQGVYGVQVQVVEFDWPDWRSMPIEVPALLRLRVFSIEKVA